MKLYTLNFLFLFLIHLAVGQIKNKEVLLDGNRAILLGKIDKTGLTSKNYNSWFSKNFDAYQIDHSTIKKIKPLLKEIEITAFMGTWCGDSKREVPKFFKILESCNYPMQQLNLIAVNYEADSYKQSPNHEELGLNIHRVPTFIFYKNGVELNRIVEEPVVSFETDMLNILTHNTYKSNYQIVETVDSVLKNEGLEILKSKRTYLVKTFIGSVSSIYELNTYSKILISTNKKEEALEVLKLNTLLFPEDPVVFERLVKVLRDSNQNMKANETLKKALKKFPKNEQLLKLLAEKHDLK